MELGGICVKGRTKSEIGEIYTVRVIKNVTITENRQRKVNDYPITVNGYTLSFIGCQLSINR